MLAYIILGLLRDGGTAHGYQLALAHQARSGQHIATSSFYRDLARLRDDGLVETTANPPGTDARRIPHRITERGRVAFDRWMTAASPTTDAIDVRALFLDRVPAAGRAALFAQWHRELRTRAEQRRLDHETALAKRRWVAAPFDPLPAMLARDHARLQADLAMLDQLRRELGVDGMQTAADCATS